MALDAKLLENRGGFRVYGWDRAWVSLGRFQTPELALLSTVVPHVMRPTGGKAVLHGHDVTVGWCASLSSLGVSDSRAVKQAYRAMIEPLIRAMRAAGAQVDLAERTGWVRGAGRAMDCFAHISPNDVVDLKSGAKVVGCALQVSSSAVLLQASIPVLEPLVPPEQVFAHPGPKPSVRMDGAALVQALFKELAQA